MRILFINPNLDTGGFKPLAISVLSAMAKEAGHTVDIFDTSFFNVEDYSFNRVHVDSQQAGEEVLNFIPVDYSAWNLVEVDVDLETVFTNHVRSFSPDLIALTIFSQEYALGMELLKMAKEVDSGVTTIVGGVHCYGDPQGVIANDCVDFLCMGEGEALFSKFMKGLETGHISGDQIEGLWWKDQNGEVHKSEVGPYTELDTIPYLNYEEFDDRLFYRPFNGKMYRSADHVLTRGCFERCTYCLFDKMYDTYGNSKSIRKYSIDRSISELEYLVDKHNLEFIRFHDADFLHVSPKYLREYATEYARQIGLPFVIDATPQMVSKEKVRCLKEMNCQSISVGVETGNEELRLNTLNKKATNENILNAFHIINSFDIRTVSFILLGFPFETRQYYYETIELIREARVDCPNVGFVYPFKGSALRETSIRDGHFDPTIEINGAPQYARNYPIIKNPDITVDEYKGLYRTFMFYCKFPKSYYPDIRVAERLDEAGNEMYAKLRKEYEDQELFNLLAPDLPVPPDPRDTPDPASEELLDTTSTNIPVTIGQRF
ncbi:uncharacterized protein METZ01_LOCUS192196 [marine metagenome]|uniref:Uncharacterized protein n=1 Tax=marine metagenome TaxID=408172 RepID=A0A382DMV1_9ZZZZ